MKAMILAAGLGTRLKPFTDYHPKALAPVNGKSLLQRNIEYLKSYGYDNIIVNVHHMADQILAHLEQHQNFGISITISDESDAVLETGGGLKKAAWFFDATEPFCLMNVDILTDLNLKDMLQYHQQHQPLATLGVSHRHSSRCFLFDRQMHLCGWRNRQSGEERISVQESNLQEYSFSGIHLINPKLLKLMKHDGKFSMVDVYLDLAKTESIMGFDHSGCLLLDVGKPESIAEAETMFD
ncbi:MAG: nucleotidyltransferase family protein [Chitinophagaceae bacterium]|nr:nucleotidyltransferase family protein [Chitinophagaceae bacterium]